MTRRDYERAKLRGMEARQRGAKREESPYRNKPALRVLDEAWTQGWQAQDSLNRAPRSWGKR